jgi:hypothetical protein
MATRNTSSQRTSAARGGAKAKNQIVAMLKADHKKVKKAFKDFQKLDPHEDKESCEALVEQTLAEIEVHAQLEEQIFYPAARGAIDEQELLDEAEVEHMTAKVLIEQLKGMDADDEKFAATFKVLGEYINHHVQEEEGEMFKQLSASGAEWDAVLEEMQAQREQLMEEKGLPAEGEAPERMAAERGAQRASRSVSGRGGEAESRPQAASRSSKPSPEKS